MSSAVTRALFAALMIGSGAAAFGQYQLSQWTNFEDGKLPEGAVPFGRDAASRLQIVDLDSVSGMPPEFHRSAESKETGSRALQVESVNGPTGINDFVVGLGTDTVVDRDRLGASGMALFQADFFIPAGGPIPAMAVLATEPLMPPPANLPPMPRDYYRFGFSAGGLYASCVSKRDPKIAFLKKDPTLWKQIPRAGWHRLAIVFEGSETIRCYVDGRETAFSPIQHPSLRTLQVGIMQAEDKVHYKSYVDNLSIQLSGEAMPLPDSPYAGRWKTAPAGGGSRPEVLNAGLAGTDWLDPEAAWAQAKQTGKPLLLYFNAPTVPATQQLNDLLGSRPEAKSFLQAHCCARVDVNQLQGGSIARKYGIFRVPAFLVITPQATEGGRAVFTREDTWDSFAAQLSRKP